MEPFPLSISIVTCNEEKNIERCLASSAHLAKEIIVVDSGSTDNTVEIAESYGAKVIHQEWQGYRDQKNIALEHCTQPWILALDSDEALTPELNASIVKFLEKEQPEQVGGAKCNRLVWFLGKWIKHGDWYPDTKIRLFRREKSKWIGSVEHDHIETEGDVIHLQGDLLHFSFDNMSAYITKMNSFADIYLERQLQKDKKFSAIEVLFRSFWRFFRAYFLRLGFLDGFPGLWIALSTGYQTFMRHTRIYEHRNSQDPSPDSIHSNKKS